MVDRVRILGTPTVLVNGENIGIEPNSFSYVLGVGTRNARASSTGGGNVQISFSENAETKVGQMKFTLLPTAANLEQVEIWQRNFNANVVQCIDNDTQFNKTMNFGVVSEDPENNMGADGSNEVLFKGDPLV